MILHNALITFRVAKSELEWDSQMTFLEDVEGFFIAHSLFWSLFTSITTMASVAFCQPMRTPANIPLSHGSWPSPKVMQKAFASNKHTYVHTPTLVCSPGQGWNIVIFVIILHTYVIIPHTIALIESPCKIHKGWLKACFGTEVWVIQM